MIEFACPCGQIYRIEEKFEGRKIKCKECGVIVEIPEAPKVSAPAAQRAARPAPARKPSQPPVELESSDTDNASDDVSESELIIKSASRLKWLPRKVRLNQEKKELTPMEAGVGTGWVALDRATTKPKPGLSRSVVIGALVLCGLAAVAGVGLGLQQMLQVQDEPPGPVAKQYATVKHELGNFVIKYPTDWKPRSGGGTDAIPPWASFEGNDGHVRVRADPGGSVIGSLATAGADVGLDVPQDDAASGLQALSPVAVVHAREVGDVKGNFLDYQESRAEMIHSEGFGEGRMSTFTGISGFSPYKGIRCTFLASDFQYTIVCQIPEKKFDNYESVFLEMVRSFRR